MTTLNFIDLKDNKQSNKNIKKLYNEAFPKEEEEETEGDVVDLMEALRKSVDHARSTKQSGSKKSGKRKAG